MPLMLKGDSALTAAEHEILTTAYGIAVSELISAYDFKPEELKAVDATVSEAMSGLFRAGQRYPQALARYAIHKAILARRSLGEPR